MGDDVITIIGPDGNPMRIAASAVDPSKYQSLPQAPISNYAMSQTPEYQAEANAAPGLLNELTGGPVNKMMGVQDPTMQAQEDLMQKELAAEAVQKAGVPVNVEGSNMPPAPTPNFAPSVAKQAAVDPVQQGNDLRIGAANQIAGIAEKLGTFKANEQEAYNKTMEENMEKSAKEAKKRQEVFQNVQTTIDDNAKQLAANPPKDFWADRSSGAKVLAALSMGIGAYAATTGGGQNYAMKIIDDAIQRDANLQAAKRQGLKEAGATKLSGYQTQLAALGDASAARDADVAAKYKFMLGKVQQYENGLKGAEAKAQVQDLKGQLQTAYGVALQSAAEKAAKSTAEKSENFIPSLGVYAYSKKAAEGYNELAAATNTAADGIQELQRIGNIKGKEITPKVRAEAETIASLVRASLRVPILGPGTVNDAERALMEKIVADPTTIFSLSESNQTRLTTLATRLQANLKQQQRAYGLSGQGPTQKISSFKAD